MSIPRRSYTLAVTRPGNLTSLPAAKIAVFQACELDLTLRLPTGETFDGATKLWLEIHASQTSDPNDVLTTFVVDSPTGNSITIGLTGDYLNHSFTGPLGEFWLVIAATWEEEDRVEPLRCANLFLHRHNASQVTPAPPAPIIPLTQAAADARYAALSHTQAISTITGLQTALDAKAAAADLTSEASTRAAADTALQEAINGLTSFDPASPGPIGNNTRSTGKFTRLEASQELIGTDCQIGAGGFFSWAGSSILKAPENGVVTLWNNSGSGFDRLQFGGVSSSFPAFKRNGVTMEVKLADDSGFADLKLNKLSALSAIILADYTTDTLPDPTLTPYGVVFANDESNHPQPVYSDGISWCTFGNNGSPEGPA